MMIKMMFRAGIFRGGIVATALTTWIILLAWSAGVAAGTTPRFAYGTNAGDWSLTRYLVNSDTGALRHNGHVPHDVYPAGVSVDPSGRFLVSVSMTDDTVSVQTIDPVDGSLNHVDQSPFPSRVRAPFSIAWHPSGRFMYVAARVTGVAGYEFNTQNGTLSHVPGSPFIAQRRTRSVVVHPLGHFVYASNAYDNSVSAWRVDEATGSLNPLPGSPYSTGEPGNLNPDLMRIIDAPPEAGGIPYMVAIHPSGHYLYVTNKLGPSLSMFAVNTESGELSRLPGNPMPTGGTPYAVSIHPSGRFVYVTSLDRQAIYGYAVDVKTGSLHGLADSPYYPLASNPIAVRFNAAGSLAYVPNSGSNTVSVFDVDESSGSLKLKQTMRSRYEPIDIALSEGVPAKIASRFAFVIDGQRLRQFQVGSSGELKSTSKLIAELEPGFTPRAVAVHPRGHFVYLSGEQGDKGRLGIYRINPEGGLSPLNDIPHELGIVPAEMMLDASGRFLYVIDPDKDGLFVFAVNQHEGTLSTLPDLPPRTGQQPVAIALDPVGRFSFVANAADDTVSVFTHRREGSAAMYPIDQPGSKYTVGKNPRALVVDPTGKYLFVANGGDNTLSAFKIHYHNGSLESLPRTPVPTGKFPSAVVVHPDGQWVLVANRDSGTLSIYNLNSLTGVLAIQSTVKVGSRPAAIVFDPAGNYVYVRNEGREELKKFVLDVRDGKLKPAGKAYVGPVVDVVLDMVVR